MDGIFRILGFLWAVVETFFRQGASVTTRTTTSRVKQVSLPSSLLKHSKPEQSSINIREINEIIVVTLSDLSDSKPEREQSSINVREINKIIAVTVKVTIGDHPDENEHEQQRT